MERILSMSSLNAIVDDDDALPPHDPSSCMPGDGAQCAYEDQDASSFVDDNASSNDGTAPNTLTEAQFIETVHLYLRKDNAKRELTAQTKELSGELKQLSDQIIQYMINNMILKLPTKRNGDEYLSLKVSTRVKKPTKDEMLHRIESMIRSNEIIDKTPTDIVADITRPVSTEDSHKLCRKCKKQRKVGSGLKRKHTLSSSSATSPHQLHASSSSIDDLGIAKTSTISIREMLSGQQSHQQPSSSQQPSAADEDTPGDRPLKIRKLSTLVTGQEQ